MRRRREQAKRHQLTQPLPRRNEGAARQYGIDSIIDYVRGQGKVALACASSGIAAMPYRGGKTAHSTFHIPVQGLCSTSTCNVKHEGDVAQLLRETAVVLWDDAFIAHRYQLETVHRTLRVAEKAHAIQVYSNHSEGVFLFSWETYGKYYLSSTEETAQRLLTPPSFSHDCGTKAHKFTSLMKTCV